MVRPCGHGLLRRRQTVGPALVGVIGKASGSITRAYLLAALITACAMIFALFLPQPSSAGNKAERSLTRRNLISTPCSS